MSAVLDSKLRKALELRTDSPAMLDALDSMATFWSSNTLEAVRHLLQISVFCLTSPLKHHEIILHDNFICMPHKPVNVL